jgi:hypothetical protein
MSHKLFLALLLALMAYPIEVWSKSAEEQKLDDLLGIPAQPQPNPVTAPAIKSEETPQKDPLPTEPTPSGVHIGFKEALKDAKVTFKATSYGFLSHSPALRQTDDPKDWINYANLNVDTMLNVNHDFDLKIDLFMQHGTEEDHYILENPFDLDDDIRARNFDFTQLYLKKSIGDLDMVLGKQRIDAAVNTLYSPINRISPVDATHPHDPRYLGVPQAVWTYYKEKSTTEFHFIPFYQESKPPGPGSRWATSSSATTSGASGAVAIPSEVSGFQFPGVQIPANFDVAASSSLDSTSASDEIDNISRRPELPNFFFREKLVIDSFDCYANLYYGFLPNNSLAADGFTLRKSHARGYMPSLAVATVLGKFEVHGELLAQIPEARTDDTYLNPALGFEYDLNNLTQIEMINSAKFMLDYSYEWVVEIQNNNDFPIRTDKSRPGRNNIFAFWNVEIGKHRPYYGLTFSLKDQDYSQRVGYEYKYGDGLSFELNYQWFDGPPETLFGQWHYNNILTGQLIKKF